MSEAPTGFRPGLEGVPATQSAISNIDGQHGILSYRGYRIEDLAAHSTFLETAYLLIWGELPGAEARTHLPPQQLSTSSGLHQRDP